MERSDLQISRHRETIMQFIWFVLIGIAAGWLAGQIMKGGGFGIVGDLVIGVIGALLGGLAVWARGCWHGRPPWPTCRRHGGRDRIASVAPADQKIAVIAYPWQQALRSLRPSIIIRAYPRNPRFPVVVFQRTKRDIRDYLARPGAGTKTPMQAVIVAPPIAAQKRMQVSKDGNQEGRK